MPFEVNEEGFFAETVEKKRCFIQRDSIVEIKAYTLDLATFDERRISIETTHGVIYQFSEEESDWNDLVKWISTWAELPTGWSKSVWPEPFSTKVTVLWKINS